MLPNDTPEDFTAALAEVITTMVSRASVERRGEDGWRDLFRASEGGLKSILSTAEHQMSHITLNATDVIEQRFGIKVSAHLYDLLRAMPYAMRSTANRIADEQGFACSVDKARHIYYEAVLEEINRIKAETNEEADHPEAGSAVE